MHELWNLILERGLASPTDLEAAKARYEVLQSDPVGSLLEVKLIPESILLQTIAELHQLPPLAPGPIPQVEYAIRQTLDWNLAAHHEFYPLRQEGAERLVAVSSRLAPAIRHELAKLLGSDFQERIALSCRIQAAQLRDQGRDLTPRLAAVLSRLRLPGHSDHATPTPRSQVSLAAPVEFSAVPRVPSLREFRAASIPPLSSGSSSNHSIMNQPPSDPKPRREHTVQSMPATQSPQTSRGKHRGPYALYEAEEDLRAADDADRISAVLYQYASQFFDFTAVFAIRGKRLELRSAGRRNHGTYLSGISWQMKNESGPVQTICNSKAPLIAELSGGSLTHDIRLGLGRSGNRQGLWAPISVANRVLLFIYGEDDDDDLQLSQVGEVLALAQAASLQLDAMIRRGKQAAASRAVPENSSSTPLSKQSATDSVSPNAIRSNAAAQRTSEQSSASRGHRAAPGKGWTSLVKNFGPSSESNAGQSSETSTDHSDSQEPRDSRFAPDTIVEQSLPISASPTQDTESKPTQDPPTSRPKATARGFAMRVRKLGGELPALGARLNESSSGDNERVTAPNHDSSQQISDVNLHNPPPTQLTVPPNPTVPPTTPRFSGQGDSAILPLENEYPTAVSAPIPSPIRPEVEESEEARSQSVTNILAMAEAAFPGRSNHAATRPMNPVTIPPEAIPETTLEELGVEVGPAPKANRVIQIAETAPMPPVELEEYINASQIPNIPHNPNVQVIEPELERRDRARSLLQQLVNGDRSALSEVLLIDANILSLAADRFPGKLDTPWSGGDQETKASDHGALPTAIVALGPIAVPFLVARCNSEDAHVRLWATLLLGELGGTEAVRAVGKRLGDENPIVRQGALGASRLLIESPISEKELCETLAKIARSEEKRLPARIAALESLCELRLTNAVPDLIDTLNSPEEDLKETARMALAILTRQDYGYSSTRWHSWWIKASEQHRIEWLIDALAHDDFECRKAAGIELKQLTKEYFGYYPDLSRSERLRAQDRYREWWNKEGFNKFVESRSIR